jgi:hypothetical protein
MHRCRSRRNDRNILSSGGGSVQSRRARKPLNATRRTSAPSLVSVGIVGSRTVLPTITLTHTCNRFDTHDTSRGRRPSPTLRPFTDSPTPQQLLSCQGCAPPHSTTRCPSSVSCAHHPHAAPTACVLRSSPARCGSRCEQLHRCAPSSVRCQDD